MKVNITFLVMAHWPTSGFQKQPLTDEIKHSTYCKWELNKAKWNRTQQAVHYSRKFTGFGIRQTLGTATNEPCGLYINYL